MRDPLHRLHVAAVFEHLVKRRQLAELARNPPDGVSVGVSVGDADAVELPESVVVGDTVPVPVLDAVPLPVCDAVGVCEPVPLPDREPLPVAEAEAPSVRLGVGEPDSVALPVTERTVQGDTAEEGDTATTVQDAVKEGE